MAGAVTITLLSLLAIPECLTMAFFLRQTQPFSTQDAGSAGSFETFSQPASTTTKRFAEARSELTGKEIQEDMVHLAEFVEHEEEKLGHPLTNAEAENVEKQLEELPWYRRLGNWLDRTYNSAKDSVNEFFSAREKSEGQLGYPDFYSFNS